MGLPFVVGHARTLVQRLIGGRRRRARDSDRARSRHPPSSSNTDRCACLTARPRATYNPLLHVGIGVASCRRRPTFLGTGYQMDILDGEDRLLVRCKAKVAAKQDQWIGVRFTRSNGAPCGRAPRSPRGSPRPGRSVRCRASARGVRVGGVTVAPGEARAVTIPLQLTAAAGLHPATGAAGSGARRPRRAAPAIPAWVVVPAGAAGQPSARYLSRTTAALAAAGWPRASIRRP
jgi:hypothetical protein